MVICNPFISNTNYGAPPAHSVSTGASSIFSSDGDNYDQRIKEIEEYYVKTLLREDDERLEEYDAVHSDVSSVTNSPKQSFAHYQPLNYFKPSVPVATVENQMGSGSSRDHHNKNSLEVEINSNLRPSIDPLPLTTENLQRLSIAPVESKVDRKNVPHVQNTTKVTQEPQLNKELYKTELCESFTTKGHCKYGNKCQFAHGLNELKLKPRSNNFRTKPCINWTKLGYCPYGKRCCFKHGDDHDIKIYMQAGNNTTLEANKRPKNLHANVKALQKITW